MKPTGWLTLFDGTDLDKWVVQEGIDLDGNTMAITSEGGRAEAGGQSWDNYLLRGEFLITPKGKNPKYCVQLTADGTCVYCQLVPHSMNIAYYCDKPKGFTHLIAPVRKFLCPTKKQLEEFDKHPIFNWLKYKETKKK